MKIVFISVLVYRSKCRVKGSCPGEGVMGLSLHYYVQPGNDRRELAAAVRWRNLTHSNLAKKVGR